MESENRIVVLEYNGYYIPEVYTFEVHGNMFTPSFSRSKILIVSSPEPIMGSEIIKF